MLNNDLISGNKNIWLSALYSKEIVLQGPHDIPIRIQETGDEDYKCIRLTDKNNTTRYELYFSSGHLKFRSWDSTGKVIVDNSQII